MEPVVFLVEGVTGPAISCAGTRLTNNTLSICHKTTVIPICVRSKEAYHCCCKGKKRRMCECRHTGREEGRQLKSGLSGSRSS